MNKEKIAAIAAGLMSARAKENKGSSKTNLKALNDAIVGAAAGGYLAELFGGGDAPKANLFNQIASQEAELYEARGQERGKARGIVFIQAYANVLKEPLTQILIEYMSDDKPKADKWLDQIEKHLEAKRDEIDEDIYRRLNVLYSMAVYEGTPIVSDIKSYLGEDASRAAWTARTTVALLIEMARKGGFR